MAAMGEATFKTKNIPKSVERLSVLENNLKRLSLSTWPEHDIFSTCDTSLLAIPEEVFTGVIFKFFNENDTFWKLGLTCNTLNKYALGYVKNILITVENKGKIGWVQTKKEFRKKISEVIASFDLNKNRRFKVSTLHSLYLRLENINFECSDSFKILNDRTGNVEYGEVFQSLKDNEYEDAAEPYQKRLMLIASDMIWDDTILAFIGKRCFMAKHLSINWSVEVSSFGLTGFCTMFKDLRTLILEKPFTKMYTMTHGRPSLQKPLEKRFTCNKNEGDIDHDEIFQCISNYVWKTRQSCLEKLEVNGQWKITDQTLDNISKYCTKLRTLHLFLGTDYFRTQKDQFISSKSFRRLANKCIDLEDIVIEGIHAPTDGVIMALIEKCKNLRRMEFDNCTKITHKVLKCLSSTTRSTITSLVLKDCKKLSLEDIQKVKENMKGVDIRCYKPLQKEPIGGI